MISARRLSRTLAAMIATGILVQLSCVAALAAAQGVALDTGRISVQTPLDAGKSYDLAKLGVRNPGAARTKYDLVVTPIQTSAQTPQASWISFAPKQLTVQPGKQQAVSVSIRLPQNAAPGRYEVLVGARVAPAANGMAIAAGAAARLTFTIAGRPLAEPIVSVIGTWWPIPAAALLVVGGWFGRSRFRLRLPIERRPAG